MASTIKDRAGSVANPIDLSIGVGTAISIIGLKGTSLSYSSIAYDGSLWLLNVISAQLAAIQAAITADTSNAISAISTVDATKVWLRAEFIKKSEVDWWWFGARPNATAEVNSQAARDLSSVVTALGGNCSVNLPAGGGGTYTIGDEQFSGAGGAGYAYRGKSLFSFTGLPKLTVRSNGANIKYAAGLHFGSFNPTTGAVFNPGALPFIDINYSARLGRMLIFDTCDSLSLEGELFLDGNQANLTYGGDWGDQGIQLDADGVQIIGCKNLRTSSQWVTEKFARDGIVHHIEGTGGIPITDASAPINNVMDGWISRNNARNSYSLTGGKGVSHRNCQFIYGGKGLRPSAPGAGIDIECSAYGVATNIIRDILFDTCVLHDLQSVVGDNARITFRKSQLYGIKYYSAIITAPGVVFDECIFSGMFAPLAAATIEADRMRLPRCRFGAIPYSATDTVYGFTLIETGSGAQNPIFENYIIDTTGSTKSAGYIVGVGAEFRDGNINQSSTATISAIFQAKFSGVNNISGAGAFYVDLYLSKTVRDGIVNGNANVFSIPVSPATAIKIPTAVGGTANAIQVTLPSGAPITATPQLIILTVPSTNTGAATLSADAGATSVAFSSRLGAFTGGELQSGFTYLISADTVNGAKVLFQGI
jgi:hypothetical protein